MRTAFIGVLMSLVTVSATAEVIPGSAFVSAGWVGDAHTDETGRFSHCAVSSDYVSGDTLIFSINRAANIGIGVVSSRLRLQPLSEYPVTVQIDRGYRRHGIAVAVSNDYFIITLTDFRTTLEAIRFGNILSVQGNGFLGEYQLTGTSVGLDRTRQCAVDFLDYVLALPTPPAPPSTGGRPEGGPSDSATPSPSIGTVLSGTAFMLNDGGYLMTNEHVVHECASVTVSGNTARIVGHSEQFDLAVLHVAELAGRSSLSLAPNPAVLNEEIVAAGFPLQNLLGGLNVTQGSVTSMTGIGGDAIVLQHSAPIQPGSSGGPLVDEFGNVVGVVNAQLAPDAIGGTNPNAHQNVNFAVRSEVAQLVLSQNGVSFSIGDEQEALRPVELGALVRDTTYSVRCEQ